MPKWAKKILVPGFAYERLHWVLRERQHGTAKLPGGHLVSGLLREREGLIALRGRLERLRPAPARQPVASTDSPREAQLVPI